MSFFELEAASDAASLAAWIELVNSTTAEISGNHDEDRLVRNPVALFEVDPFQALQVFGAGDPARPEGYAEMRFQVQEDLDLVTFRIIRRADSEVGPRLFDELVQRALAAGRRKLRTYLDDRDAVLLELYRSRGFVETQRTSVSVLSASAGQPAVAAPAGYDLVQWRDRCPEELVEAFAIVCARMSTDAPQGEAIMEAQVWDVERVRRVEAAHVEQGRQTHITAVRRRGSGELAGYTALNWHPDQPVAAMQGGTLVLREHRGRGLGRWIKTTNLQAAGQRWPSMERIYTGNAEENAPMLRINRAMGYLPDKTFRTLDLNL